LITNKKLFLKETLKALLKLIIAGILIGVLKEYDAIIAGILVLKIIHNVYKEIIQPKTNKNWLLLIGMLLTGFGGIIGETWGVANGYWEYHEVTRELPLWLPFAWMLAFHYLYKLERTLIPLLKEKTQKNKVFLAILLALILRLDLLLAISTFWSAFICLYLFSFCTHVGLYSFTFYL